jgi:hypothetical protein
VKSLVKFGGRGAWELNTGLWKILNWGNLKEITDLGSLKLNINCRKHYTEEHTFKMFILHALSRTAANSKILNAPTYASKYERQGQTCTAQEWFINDVENSEGNVC